MDNMIYFIDAKYHLSVAERLIADYVEYPNKQFLVGAINESAISVLKLIRAFSMNSMQKREYNNFFKKIAPKYLDEISCVNLIKVLEIQKAQKDSSIEFIKNGKIILLINGKYRFLTIDRIKELVKSVRYAISQFSPYFFENKLNR